MLRWISTMAFNRCKTDVRLRRILLYSSTCDGFYCFCPCFTHFTYYYVSARIYPFQKLFYTAASSWHSKFKLLFSMALQKLHILESLSYIYLRMCRDDLMCKKIVHKNSVKVHGIIDYICIYEWVDDVLVACVDVADDLDLILNMFRGRMWTSEWTLLTHIYEYKYRSTRWCD